MAENHRGEWVGFDPSFVYIPRKPCLLCRLIRFFRKGKQRPMAAVSEYDTLGGFSLKWFRGGERD